MKIGLAAFRCENQNLAFNMKQIERGMQEVQGRADLICFGEAFLQGFDALCWDYEADRHTALSLRSPEISTLKAWTEQYQTGLLTGYFEKDSHCLYSSCVLMEHGKVLYNYRRVTRGWKEFRKTDSHYREGNIIRETGFHGRSIQLALCGDLWDEGWERFRTDSLLLWPVYTDFTAAEWENEEISAYARRAAMTAEDVLMVNSICHSPENIGGAFHFHDGKAAARLPFGEEQILLTEL